MPDTDQATIADFNSALWVWGSQDSAPRVLHAMIRVPDWEPALRFYVEGLGMKILDRFTVEVRRTDLMFIGYGDYTQGGVIELVRIWDDESEPTHGTGYGHVAIGAPDVVGTVEKLAVMGAEILTPPTVLMPGGPHVAFVKDFHGYTVELIQMSRY
jgi:lactoylglutathione lyase